MNFRHLTLVGCLLLFPLLWNTLSAHAPNQSYWYFSVYEDAIDGRYELNAQDLNKALRLGLPVDLTDAVIAPHLDQIHAYLRERTSVKAGEREYAIRFTETKVFNLDDEDDYVRFYFVLDGVEEIPESLDVDYDLINDLAEAHRGMLIIEHNWKAGIIQNGSQFSNIFSQGNSRQELSLAESSVWRGFWALLKLGVWHIWIGLDHILFILALILPSVVRRRKRENVEAGGKSWEWVPVESFRDAFFYILKIVTFFTVAHSITLALAALNIVDLPSNIIEAIIALSIAAAALHNITPVFKTKEWMIAFGFGLFHGFGFASVLGEKGLSGEYMIWSLLGFNLGVEVGQVLIICLIFPVLFLVRKQKWYPAFITFGSAILIALSLHWAVERAFGFNIRLVDGMKKLVGLK